jgi:hypothetical protein
MKASIFKKTNDINDIFSFLMGKNLIEQPATDVFDFANIEHKFFEISNIGDTIFVSIFHDHDEIKDLEKEFKKIIEVSYLIFVKDDFSEFIFMKNDQGTGKLLRLRKKVRDMNAAFLKKLDAIDYNNFPAFEKLFDRSEFIKEFYQIYSDSEKYLFKNIKGIPEEEEKEFLAKLIIQRIMFLWFLQKKGLLDSNEDYFVEKFNLIKENKGNFYNDFLKELFFEGLCKKISARNKDTVDLIGDVPYLNGGLFVESDVELIYNNIEIDNSAFYRLMEYPILKNEKNIPVLNLLECKEWTVDERSGEVDKLNPEVLGYIFEKSINQKELGAVYTPEQITTYICKNTIFPYLINKINVKYETNFKYNGNILEDLLNKLDEAQLYYLLQIVSNIKILDPAVGSGHFLVDAIITLEPIYKFFRNNKIIDLSNFEIREKIIIENIFGVDVLPEAVEICKLRLFLSLAETFRSKEDIKPLPNIEFNIRCGNSLIGFTSESEMNQKFFGSGKAMSVLLENIDFIRNNAPNTLKQAERILPKSKFDLIDPNDLFQLRNELIRKYKTLHDHDLQTEFRKLLYNITDAFNSELNNQFYGLIEGIFKKERDLKKLKTKEKMEKFYELRPFHWMMEYSEVMENGGFDIIIENPPYVGFKKITKFERKFLELLFNPIYNGKNDLMYYFMFRHKNLTKESSQIGIITSRYFLEGKYAEKLRNFLIKNLRILEITDFHGLRPFEGISVDPLIIFFENNSPNEVKIAKLTVNTNPSVISKIFDSLDKEEDSIFYERYKVKQNDLNKDGYWILCSNIQSEILKQMDKNTCQLSKIATINQGIITSNDKAFVISPEVLSDLNLDSNENKLIKRWCKNSDVKKWRVDDQQLNKLIYLNWDSKIDNYPHFKEHVLPFKEKLSKRREVKQEKMPWWALHWPRDKSIFEKTKILVPYKTRINRFAYDELNYFASADVYAINTKNQFDAKLLIGILNSKLIEFWIKLHAKKLERQYEYYPYLLERIPIKSLIGEKIEIEIVDLVESLIISDSPELLKVEEHLNELIFRLYDINDDKLKKEVDYFLDIH